MEKNEKRSVIKYLLMKGLSAQQIHLDMKEVLGDDAPSQATVYRNRYAKCLILRNKPIIFCQ